MEQQPSSAPYRAMTVQDAISDLPDVGFVERHIQILSGLPLTDYQRLVCINLQFSILIASYIL
jgi:hypothetical protein